VALEGEPGRDVLADQPGGEVPEGSYSFDEKAPKMVHTGGH
jgi:hypothetical protein